MICQDSLFKITMKKETKITQDKTQTRATIPKVFVDEFEVTKDHKIEWDNKGGKLKGELKKFSEEVDLQ